MITPLWLLSFFLLGVPVPAFKRRAPNLYTYTGLTSLFIPPKVWKQLGKHNLNDVQIIPFPVSSHAYETESWSWAVGHLAFCFSFDAHIFFPFINWDSDIFRHMEHQAWKTHFRGNICSNLPKSTCPVLVDMFWFSLSIINNNPFV